MRGRAASSAAVSFFSDTLKTLIAPAYSLLYEPAVKRRKAEDAAIEEQRRAQDEAKNAALSQARRAEMDAMARNRKTPDMASLLSAEQAAAAFSGAGATLLTGAGGIDRKKLKLGQSSLLGA